MRGSSGSEALTASRGLKGDSRWENAQAAPVGFYQRTRSGRNPTRLHTFSAVTLDVTHAQGNLRGVKRLRSLHALFFSTLALTAFSSEAAAQVTLPFIEDWEGTNGETYTALTASLAGAPEWSFEPLATGGRLRMAAGAGFYASGNAAATLDRDNTSTTTIINYLTLTLDMSNFNVANDNIVLDFSHMQHGDESSTNDRIWVRGSSADPYVELYNLTVGGPPSGQYQNVIDVDVTAALLSASQNYSSTTQFRFGQEDNFPATSPTGTDGRTFDDIIIRRVLNDDLAVSAIATPVDQSCGETMHDVGVTVLNAGANTQSMIPLVVTVSGDINVMFNTTVMGPLAKNQSVTEIVGQINTYPGVNIDITAEIMLPGDEDTANDLLMVSRTLKPTEITLVSMPADVCPGDSATIDVSPEPLADFELWDSMMGGMLLDTGTTLTTPPVDVMTTFYIERINATLNGAALDNTIGMGGPYGTFTDGLVFDVTQPIIIQSVNVYPNSTGPIQVTILDSADNVIGSSMVYNAVMGDVGNKTLIPVGVSLPVGGGYKITAEGSGVAMYRNTDGAAYPYDINGWVNITGNTPNLPSSYYFFYDWAVSEDVPVCSDERTPVDVDVDPALCTADLVVDMTGPDTANPGDTVEYVTVVTNNGPSAALGASVDITTPTGFTFVSNAGDCTTGSPCDLSNLDPAAMATITTTFTVNDDFDGTATVSATASSGSTEGNPGDETDSVDTTVMGMTGTGGGGTGGTGGTGTGMGTGGDSSGSSGNAGEGEDGGCGCRTTGNPTNSAGWLLLLGGIGALGVRRPRD